MKNKKIVVSFILVGIVLFFLFNISHKQNTNTVTIDGTTLQVDLATTAQTQEQGLSGRPSLAQNAGMLFIFAKPDKYYFWMKGMNFPIDMIWFDENMKVIYIQKNAIPESYPTSFGPDTKSNYVLEVVSGFSDTHNIKVGDVAQFSL